MGGRGTQRLRFPFGFPLPNPKGDGVQEFSSAGVPLVPFALPFCFPNPQTPMRNWILPQHHGLFPGSSSTPTHPYPSAHPPKKQINKRAPASSVTPSRDTSRESPASSTPEIQPTGALPLRASQIRMLLGCSAGVVQFSGLRTEMHFEGSP